MKIDGYTRMAAVLARPIKHSMSPLIHNSAFDKTGINGVYVAWDVPAEDVQISLDNIKRYNMFGLNISMPYKKIILPYLDEITLDAALIGSVNTVVNRDGLLIGHNTDGKGFFRSLPHFQIQDKVLTIFGGGGVATAIVTYALLYGAKEVFIFSSSASLEVTKERMVTLSEKVGATISVFPVEEEDLIQEKVDYTDLLVNATNVGMDSRSMILPAKIVFNEKMLVADVIYQPSETPFLKLARSQGVKAVNGLGMLLYQAAESFELWTGVKMPIDEIWKELKTYEQ